jgi:NADH-quinone oxidoreductase subunit M
VALTGTVVSAVYGLRAAARVFFGPQTEAFSQVAAANPTLDLGWGEKLPAFLLVAALLFIGIWPKSFSTEINRALMGSAQAAVAGR